MATIPTLIFASKATHLARLEKIFATTLLFNIVETITRVEQLIQSSYPMIPDLAVIDLSNPHAASAKLWATLHVLYSGIHFVGLVESPINKITLQAALHAGVKHFAYVNESKEKLREIAQAAYHGAFRIAPPEAYEAMTSIFESMEKNVLQIGSLKLDFDQRQAHLDHQIVNLTPLEFNLLAYLVHYADRAISSEELLKEVWKSDFQSGGTKNQLKSCIERLRKKLGTNAPSILSARGYGYRIATEE